MKPKIVSLDYLPLRGFLKCPLCDRMLTGSESKGKMGKYYYYYHCTAVCLVRFNAADTNNKFIDQLNDVILKPGILEVYKTFVTQDFKNQTKYQNAERRKLMSQLDALNIRMQNARIQKVDGTLDDDDFNLIKVDTNTKIEKLERELGKISNRNKEIDSLLEYGLNKLSGLGSRYVEGTVKERREILSSIFPENIVFDGEVYRTPRVNAVAILIYQKTSNLTSKKKWYKSVFF